MVWDIAYEVTRLYNEFYKSMNILIVTQILDKKDPILGFFHRWVLEFSKKFEKVTVICLKKGEVDLPNTVKVLSLGKENSVNRLKYLWRFYKYIWTERKNYDSVFVHMNQIYVILGGLAWRLLRKKIGLWYAHGKVPMSLRLATLLADLIFTSTSSGFRIASRKKNIIGQGIDSSLFPKSDTSANNDRLISVGRISQIKNYETLVRAIEILAKPGTNLKVDIIGPVSTDRDKKYLGNLKSEISNLGLDDNFSFIDPVVNDKLASCLKMAKLFVNTSLTGSLDKTILEAMSVGLPVVTCNESVDEIYDENCKFLLFPPRDPVALADKIKKVLALDAVKYRELSNQMSEIAARHSLNRLVDKIQYLLSN